MRISCKSYSQVPSFGPRQGWRQEIRVVKNQQLIYASNELEDRRQLWISLRDTAVAFDLSSHPWMVCGDFNEILEPRESSNPAIINSTRAMREFASCLSDIGVFDLASQGPRFTWSNHRPSDPIGKKIDRCLVNDRWQLSYPKGFCSFEPSEFSDHTPCHIRLTSTRPEFGSRAFMFPSYLANLPSFVPTIKDCWIQFGAPAKNLTSLCYRLKQLKSPIKTLCKENFSQIKRRVQEAKAVLDSHQLQYYTYWAIQLILVCIYVSVTILYVIIINSFPFPLKDIKAFWRT